MLPQRMTKLWIFVIDKQLPFHEELIDLIENGSTEDLQKHGSI